MVGQRFRLRLSSRPTGAAGGARGLGLCLAPAPAVALRSPTLRGAGDLGMGTCGRLCRVPPRRVRSSRRLAFRIRLGLRHFSTRLPTQKRLVTDVPEGSFLRTESNGPGRLPSTRSQQGSRLDSPGDLLRGRAWLPWPGGSPAKTKFPLRRRGAFGSGVTEEPLPSTPWGLSSAPPGATFVGAGNTSHRQAGLGQQPEASGARGPRRGPLPPPAALPTSPTGGDVPGGGALAEAGHQAVPGPGFGRVTASGHLAGGSVTRCRAKPVPGPSRGGHGLSPSSVWEGGPCT